MRNLQSKVPEDLWPEVKARSTACYQAPSPALARLLRDDIAATYSRDLPSAVACLVSVRMKCAKAAPIAALLPLLQ